jgi:5'(3')-deoxyribonucleotidase
MTKHTVPQYLVILNPNQLAVLDAMIHDHPNNLQQFEGWREILTALNSAVELPTPTK